MKATCRVHIEQSNRLLIAGQGTAEAALMLFRAVSLLQASCSSKGLPTIAEEKTNLQATLLGEVAAVVQARQAGVVRQHDGNCDRSFGAQLPLGQAVGLLRALRLHQLPQLPVDFCAAGRRYPAAR